MEEPWPGTVVSTSQNHSRVYFKLRENTRTQKNLAQRFICWICQIIWIALKELEDCYAEHSTYYDKCVMYVSKLNFYPER